MIEVFPNGVNTNSEPETLKPELGMCFFWQFAVIPVTMPYLEGNLEGVFRCMN
jgi:hypothetical protein